MKLGSFKVVVSTAGIVFISLDYTSRVSLASDKEGYSMLASNGNTKPLLASLGLPPRRYLQTGGKAPEGFAPSSLSLWRPSSNSAKS